MHSSHFLFTTSTMPVSQWAPQNRARSPGMPKEGRAAHISHFDGMATDRKVETNILAEILVFRRSVRKNILNNKLIAIDLSYDRLRPINATCGNIIQYVK